MAEWVEGPILAIGGIVAVGFDGDASIVVGSHSGLAVIDAPTGDVVERAVDPDGDYAWYHADPPAIRRATADGLQLIPSAGLWGGHLDPTTPDGWVATARETGVVVTRPGDVGFSVDDTDELRAWGFSPPGSVCVVATSATLYVYVR